MNKWAKDNDTVYKNWRKKVGTDSETTRRIIDPNDPKLPKAVGQNRYEELAKLNANLHIIKLAEQAGAETWSRAPMRAVTGLAFTDENLEKFAELIVAECLEACSRANEIRHFVPPTQEQVVLNCMREIETTFRS